MKKNLWFLLPSPPAQTGFLSPASPLGNEPRIIYRLPRFGGALSEDPFGEWDHISKQRDAGRSLQKTGQQPEWSSVIFV